MTAHFRPPAEAKCANETKTAKLRLLRAGPLSQEPRNAPSKS